VRALAESQLADVVGGFYASQPPCCKRDTPTVMC
jgi:hypothetical protein